MIKEIKLTRPIMAHGEKLHVLELREPTFDEVEALGFPFEVSAEGGVKVDSKIALKYIPALAGIPRSSAAKLALRDVFMVSMAIMGFFTSSETGSTSENDSTTSPTSGE